MFSLSMVKPSKDQKGKAVLNAFIEIVNESDCKTNFYGLMKKDGSTINLYQNG